MKYFALILSLVATLSFAREGSDEVQNGGDGLYCESREQQMQLYDYFEGRVVYKIPEFPQFDYNSGSTFYDLAEYAINRLKRVDSVRATRYLEMLDSFESDTLWLEDSETLIEIDDTLATVIPEDCKLVQLALHQPPLATYRYFIQTSAFNLLTIEHKAGLILHEIVYRDARELFFHNNSRRVRLFNSWLASGKMSHMPKSEYLELLKATDLNPYYTDPLGTLFLRDNLQITANGFVANGIAAADSTGRRQKIAINNVEYTIDQGSKLSFTNEGQPIHFGNAHVLYTNLKYRCLISAQAAIAFDKTGYPHQFKTSGDNSYIDLVRTNKNCPGLLANKATKFSTLTINGKTLQSGILLERSLLLSSSTNRYTHFEEDSEILFSEKGKVEER